MYVQLKEGDETYQGCVAEKIAEEMSVAANRRIKVTRIFFEYGSDTERASIFQTMLEVYQRDGAKGIIHIFPTAAEEVVRDQKFSSI